MTNGGRWEAPGSTRVISVSSGKGGVGKTLMVANLGVLWAKMGRKVLLIDGDWALGKLGIVLGVRPKWTVDKVLDGLKLSEAIQPVSENLFLLGSPSGVPGFEELSEDSRTRLFYELDRLNGEYDVILFDHGSGVSPGVTQFAAAAHQHVIVTTPEPTSYTDAYAIMKVLSRRYAVKNFQLLVNQSQNRVETEGIITRFSDVVRSHLDVRINTLEICPWDKRVAESIRSCRPFAVKFPDAELTSLMRGVCSTLDRGMARPSHGLSFFKESQIPAR